MAAWPEFSHCLNRSMCSELTGEASVMPMRSNPSWRAFCFIFSVSVIGVIIHNRGVVSSKDLQSVCSEVRISGWEE